MIKIIQTFFLFSLTFLLSANLYANHESSEGDDAIQAGIEAVENKDYPAAIKTLSEAIKEDLDNSEYHRWLARVYGLHAQDSKGFKAMSLAKKARINFEKAVELDPENKDALLDLREYYTQAPAFLGGGQDKADEVTKKLEALGYESEEAE